MSAGNLADTRATLLNLLQNTIRARALPCLWEATHILMKYRIDAGTRQMLSPAR